MEAAAIIAIVVACLTLLLGSGFAANAWRGRTRLLIETSHQAIGEDYEVVATVANAGEKDLHLESLGLIAVDELRGEWTMRGAEHDVGADLPARGRPVRHTFILDQQWVAQRSRFQVAAKISSRKKPFRSKVQSIDQGVLNVLETL